MAGADFSNKLALITGGSSGIGLALAKQLTAQGAQVWIMARDPGKLSAAAAQIHSNGSSNPVETLQADVADEAAVQAAVAALTERAGVPDLLFNCAGVAEAGRFVDHDLSIFRAMMEINYFGTLHMIQAVVPGMLQRGSGHIINFSSIAGFLGIYGYSAYGASKFAVRGLSDILRTELAEHGIRVSVVFPPDTDTPQLEYENHTKPPVTRELDKNNKVMQPEAVADAVLKGVARGRYVITPGFDSTLYFKLSNFFGLVYPVMDWMVAVARRAAGRDNGRSK